MPKVKQSQKSKAGDPPEPAAPALKKKKKVYAPEITAVAKATREALPAGARSPGAAQVAAVMAVVGDTPVADAAGISLTKLRAWAAKGEKPDEYANLRDLTKKVGDPWVQSRRLCQVLVGIEDERKSAR